VTNLPEGGTLSIGPDGCFIFSTADGDFESLNKGENATVCFTYSVCDTYGASDTAQVCIDVIGVNDLPIAVDDSYSRTVSQLNDDNGTITAEIMDNEGDPDNQKLTIVSITPIGPGGQPSTYSGDDLNNEDVYPLQNGTFTIDPDTGSVVYTPDPDMIKALPPGKFHTDQFTYVITDPDGGTDTATVYFKIVGENDPPVAEDDSETVPEGGDVSGCAL
jgi:VCBS repeat-containing protein